MSIRSASCVLSLLAVFGLQQGVCAQLAVQEPPDLAGQGLGAVAPGLNTVRGGISGTILVGGLIFGDYEDAYSFTIPTGMRATSVQLVVSNYTQLFATSGVILSGPGVNSDVPFSGNTTVNVTGVLGPGTYSVFVYANNFDDSAGNISFNHQLRITAEFNNDLCASAVAIGLGATSFQTSSAATDGPVHTQCSARGDANISRDVWFTHVASATAQMTAQTCGSLFDTKIAVYSSANCGALASSLLACNDDACGSQSSVQFSSTPGQTYLIRVGGFGNAAGAGTLTLSQFTSGACCNPRTGSCQQTVESLCTSLGLRFLGWGVACSPATCRACPADFNQSGALGVQDIFDFLAAYFAGCP